MSEESSSSAIDFRELAHTEKFTSVILNLNNNLDITNNLLDTAEKCDFDKLNAKEQVALDLYSSYAIGSLYWMYLRTKGLDPSTHHIKSEINRVRESISRANKVHNRKKASTLNKDAARRFIRSGMWQPGDKKKKDNVKQVDSTDIEEEKVVSLVDAAQKKDPNSKNGNKTTLPCRPTSEDKGKRKLLGPPHIKRGKKTVFHSS